MTIFVLCAMVLAQAQQTAVPPPPPTDGLITGRVIDGATGRPVTGVVVTLATRQPPNTPTPTRNAAPPPPRVLVDATGRFVFTGLRAGAYDLTAARRGYFPGQFGKLRADGAGLPFALAQSERRTDVTVRVWRFASLVGTVLDEMNEPIVGVSVFAHRRESIAGELRLETSVSAAITDDRGAYRLGGLMPGDYLISVPSGSDTLPVSAFNALNAGTAAPQELRDAVAIVANQPLALRDRDVVRLGDFALVERSRGVIPPGPAADGRMMVYATAYAPEPPGSAAASSLITLAAGETRTLPPIRLRPALAVRVSGVISGLVGATAPTTLMLTPASADVFGADSGLEIARTMSDQAGAFTFLGVTPGTYRVRGFTASAPIPPKELAAPGYVPPVMPTFWMSEVITVEARDTTVALTARPSVTVRGRLVFEGQRAQPTPQQISRYIVRLASADGRQARDLGRDPGAEPGHFVVSDVAGGRYVVRQSAPSGWSIRSITLNGQDVIDTPVDAFDDVNGIVLTYTDRPATLRGTVRTNANTPDPDATVLVFGTNPQRWANSGRTPMRLRAVRADAAGTFEIRDLPQGDYFVVAIADADASGWQNVKSLTEWSRLAARVQLADGATVTQDLKRVSK